MALDKQYEDRLQFRLICSLPPYSFATVETRGGPRPHLDAACRVPRLPDAGGTPEQVKHAFYQKARSMHPDAAGNDPTHKLPSCA